MPPRSAVRWVAIGAAVLLLMAAGVGILAWRMGAPARRAAAAHDAVDPGMSVEQVLGQARGAFLASVRLARGGQPEGTLLFVTTDGREWSLREGATDIGTLDRAQAIQKIVGRGPVAYVGFTFYDSGVPARSGFTVRFDAQGRVSEVGRPWRRE